MKEPNQTRQSYEEMDEDMRIQIGQLMKGLDSFDVSANRTSFVDSTNTN